MTALAAVQPGRASGEIPYLGLLEVGERIRRRELTAETVLHALLARIEQHEGRLHAFARVMGETALQEARQADREIEAGLHRGPLHGVPIGIKDLLDVAGVPCACGTEVLKDRIPGADATIIARLRRAGAVIIGKLHMTEGATLAHHPSLPRPQNPWSAAHWTGVSSSGSAVATAAGFCFAALGTDTGGSIRMPSGACGLSGIKPTWGRVSRQGLFPLAESFDHVGPMARSTADAAAVLSVIAGEDPLDPTSLPDPVPDYLQALSGGVRGLTLGVDWDLAGTDVDPGVAESVKRAAEVLQSLGARLRPVTLPPFNAARDALLPLLTAEVAVAHESTFPLHAERYGPQLRGMIEGAAQVRALDLAKATHARDRFRGAMRKVFGEVDLLLLPAAPRPTPTWDELEAMSGDFLATLDRIGRYTLPFNITGNPTLSLPGGFTSDGLPLGLQLIGPHLGEPLLCRAGHAYQQVTDYHVTHPVLS